MDNSSANPLIITLLCLVRCLIPVVVILGISYLLKRLGLILPSHERPEESPTNESSNNQKGDPAHGNA